MESLSNIYNSDILKDMINEIYFLLCLEVRSSKSIFF